MKKGQMIEIETKNKIGKVKLKLYVLKVSSTGVVGMEKNGQEHWLSPNVAKRAKVIKAEAKEVKIGQHHRLLLKKGLVQRTKARRRKEDLRRQHVYK